MKTKFVFIISALLIFVSCKKDAPVPGNNLQIEIKASFGEQEFDSENVYVNLNGHQISITRMLFYLSEIRLLKADGNEVIIDDVELIDLSNGSYSLDLEVTPDNYEKLIFNVGLNAEQNASDPNTFSAAHPLSYNQPMHWNWAQKYRFIMMDGKFETDPQNTIMTGSFSYHVGFDQLLRNKTLDRPVNISADEPSVITLNIDLQKIFYAEDNLIDVSEENITHSSGDNFDLAKRVADNFINAIN